MGRWVGADGDLWLYQRAHFSTWFRVVAIDILGYGRSAKITTPFTLKTLCDDVIGIMDDLSIDRAVCMGWSGTTILLGLDHPDRFDALILVGGNSGTSDRYMKRVEGYRSDFASYHIRHIRELVEPEFTQRRLGSYLLNMFVERGLHLSGEAIARVFVAGNSTDTTERLPEMKLPTLVINGEFDHSRAAGERTANLIPGAVHRTLPGTGHACCIEDPAGFDALVLEFLSARGLLPAL